MNNKITDSLRGVFQKVSLPASLKKAFDKVTDPLVVFTAAGYIGNAFLWASGSANSNPIRSTGAGVGAVCASAGLLGENTKILGMDARNVVMNGTRLAGLFYIVSGSNVFGFEETMRVAEMLSGAGLATAATLNINDRPKLGSVFFVATSCMYGAQAYETMVNNGQADMNMIGAFIAFMVSNVASFFMKRDEKEPPPQIEQKAFENG